jgi:hypothetical protein
LICPEDGDSRFTTRKISVCTLLRTALSHPRPPEHCFKRCLLYPYERMAVTPDKGGIGSFCSCNIRVMKILLLTILYSSPWGKYFINRLMLSCPGPIVTSPSSFICSNRNVGRRYSDLVLEVNVIHREPWKMGYFLLLEMQRKILRHLHVDDSMALDYTSSEHTVDQHCAVISRPRRLNSRHRYMHTWKWQCMVWICEAQMSVLYTCSLVTMVWDIIMA